MYCERNACMIQTSTRLVFKNGRTIALCAAHLNHAETLLQRADVGYSVERSSPGLHDEWVTVRDVKGGN